MTRSFEVIVAALCFTAFIGFSHCKTVEFVVEGKVYCDTCRVEFETPVSYSLPNAKVVLDCRTVSTKEPTIKQEAWTNSTGQYRIAVENTYGIEVCEVSLSESSDPNCNQLLDGSINSVQLTLTDRDGLKRDRYANPLSFATKEALPQCKGVLIKMGVLPENGS